MATLNIKVSRLKYEKNDKNNIVNLKGIREWNFFPLAYKDEKKKMRWCY